ncbi:hypothetical protein [Paenibacillus sp. sgz500958]|uniref:hypothetical protein n=1 Tax=Paenibacillus sp. sgz500958 TaxID=3242475 RepID=UPI0036D2F8B7
MTLEITKAELSRNEDGSFVGRAIFSLANHQANYEITFFSKKGSEWEYSLSFSGEPGSEEQFLEVDALLETDDEIYNQLLDAVIAVQDV